MDAAGGRERRASPRQSTADRVINMTSSLPFCDPGLFLQAVEKRRCLYDIAHPSYKNKAVTEQAWLELAIEFQLDDVMAAKMRWKNMKDSYIKHKKSCLTKGRTNSNYRHWKWARFIRFLEPFIYKSGNTFLLKKTCRRRTKEESTEKEDQESSQLRNYLLQKRYSVSASEDSVDMNEAKEEVESDVTDGDPLEEPAATTVELKTEPDLSESPVTVRNDEVEHLFLSYAETFRRLSSRRQLLLKGQLAALFLRAELELLQDQGLATDSELELLQTCLRVSNAIN